MGLNEKEPIEGQRPAPPNGDRGSEVRECRAVYQNRVYRPATQSARWHGDVLVVRASERIGPPPPSGISISDAGRLADFAEALEFYREESEALAGRLYDEITAWLRMCARLRASTASWPNPCGGTLAKHSLTRCFTWKCPITSRSMRWRTSNVALATGASARAELLLSVAANNRQGRILTAGLSAQYSHR